MTTEQRLAYIAGFQDALANNSPCPPDGPGYIAYLDGHADGRGIYR